jgi:hypothetical protein
MAPPSRPTEGIPEHHLSPTRLYGILLLFLVLAGYAVWKSERFQNLIQGVSTSRLSEALGVAVSFETVELRFFPPSVRLANVRIENDPALKLPADRPLFDAEEVTLGGGMSLVRRELRLGRIRAVRPHIRLFQSADGRFNLPPGLGGPSKGGLKVSIGSVLVQQGVLEFEGKKASIDGRFDDFTAELTARPRERYQGRLLVRRASLVLPRAEPLVAGLSARFLLDPRRGVTIDDFRISGAFGQVQASGEIENLDHPKIVLSARGDLVIEEIERVFRSRLGFSGLARVQAALELPSSGGFRLTGRLASARVRREKFEFDDVAATVVARPEALVAQIEQLGYAGGRATGVLRIANLTGKPQPMTLAIEGRGLSLERFFGDLDLKGTGLSGSADLSVGLRWGDAGIEHANGGGAIEIEPGPAVSLLRGRFGVPIGGGGMLAVVDGRIGFEAVTLRFPQSTLELAGGLRIGKWQPDFDIDLKSRDFAEVDHLFQNFLAATGGNPAPLGLGGSGQVQGHVAGTWANPDAAVQITAEEARYAGVTFGSARGTVDMRDGAFFFRPLRVYDGDASLSLEGMVRYRIVPGRPRFDLSLAARRYPLSRLLEYLDFRYPIEGKLTGAFPVAGTPEELTGGGPIELADATIAGQKVPLVRGTVRFTPGHFALEDVSAEIGGGMIRGSGAIAIREKTFETRAAGDKIPLEAIDAARSAVREVSGKLSFQLSGSGSLDRPDLKLSAALSEARFFGHPIPEGAQPRADVTMTRGVLDASIEAPERWTFKAHGDLFGSPARVDVSLDASDLAGLLIFTPLDMPPGRGGSLAVEGSVTLPARAGQFPTGTFTVTRARLDLPDRPGVLATSGAVRLSLADGKLTFQEFSAVGEGTSIKISGGVDLGSQTGGLTLAASGTIDASLLALVAPDVALQGRIAVDLRTSGTLQKPSFSGFVRIEKGKYRLTGLGQILDDVDASLTFHESRGDLEGRAKFGGGEVVAGGGFTFEGASVKEFRLSIQGRHVRLPTFQDFRLIADADLVATGGPAGNSIRGEVVLLRGTYSKDFDITLTDLLARGRPAGMAAVEPWKQRTTLEIRIVSSASLEVRNNVARLTGTVDLIARGTVAEPVLLGQIVLDEGGRVTFRDVRYDIESGTVTFAGSRGFAPIIDIHARAEVKGYDLVVSLVGTWPRIQTSFTSDPPLPDETILGLLLTGTAPSTRAETDTSASIVSVGAGIAAGAVTSGLTRGTQRLLKLERFEIDPVFSGGQVDVRSTIGKQIGPNVLVTYSQSFETTRLPIVQIEWRISDTIILRAQRDENGSYLVDVRRRQRY